MKEVTVTCVCRIDSETFIPEAADEDVAVVRSDDKALGMDLNTLI